MVPVISLAVPILLSAVIVFVASFILHMLLPLHRGDLRQVPREVDVMEALRSFNIPPGDYAIPHAGSPAAMRDPVFVEKMKKGPLVLMTIAPGQAPSMTKNLVMWFIYAVLVGIFAAYVAGRALGPGTPYLEVFRFAGTTAFLGYALALAQHSIWYRRRWSTTIKS